MIKEFGINVTPIVNFRETSRWPNNNYELALTIYCDKLGIKPIMQHKIVDAAAEQVSRGASTTFIFGVGNFGLGLIGKYNDLSDDGLPFSHGLASNDADIFIASDNPHGEESMMNGIQSGINEIQSDEGIAWWHRFEADWVERPSLWDVPDYVTVKFFEGGGNVREHWGTRNIEGKATLHLHHISIRDHYWWEKFLANYHSWQSNIFGAPLYLRRIVGPFDSGHTILNPFRAESNPENHIVGLTTAEEFFARSPKSILQTTRVALGVIQAGFATGVPAHIDPRALEVMRTAINLHASHLSPKQREQARERLDTILFRTRALEYHFGYRLAKALRSDFFTEYGLPNATTQVAQILDQIYWGERILGTSIQEYLQPNPIN